MICKSCNGTGSVLIVNGGRWPGLSSTVAAQCHDCNGSGRWSSWIPDTEDEAAEQMDNGRNTGGKSYR